MLAMKILLAFVGFFFIYATYTNFTQPHYHVSESEIAHRLHQGDTPADLFDTGY